MTEEEINALLAPEQELETQSRIARLRASDELLAAASSLGEQGRYERALLAVRLADMIARTVKRVNDVESAPALVGPGPGPAEIDLDQHNIAMNIVPAKSHLSALVAAAERGADVVLCRAGRPVARIVMFGEKPKASRDSAFD